jgi:uncharacterized protein with PhoU and TrkA domain
MTAATELHEEVHRLEGRVHALEALLAVLVARQPEATQDAAIAALTGIGAADATEGAPDDAPDARRIADLVRGGMDAAAEEVRQSIITLAPERMRG